MRQKIKIFHPKKVGPHDTVCGSVTPVHADTRVQVYVLSGDGLWYLQPEAVLDGHEWKAACHFGNPETANKSGKYKLVAVISDARPQSPVSAIPEGVRSPVVVVRRLPNLVK